MGFLWCQMLVNCGLCNSPIGDICIWTIFPKKLLLWGIYLGSKITFIRSELSCKWYLLILSDVLETAFLMFLFKMFNSARAKERISDWLVFTTVDFWYPPKAGFLPWFYVVIIYANRSIYTFWIFLLYLSIFLPAGSSDQIPFSNSLVILYTILNH
jgi:hypothetical protein